MTSISNGPSADSIAKANQYRDESGKFGEQPLSESNGGTASATMGFSLPAADLAGEILRLPSGEEVALDFKPTPYMDAMVTTHNDGGVTAVYLVDDDAANDMIQYVGGEDSELFEFRHESERNAFIEKKSADIGAGRVFVVDKYEHSGVHYSLAGSRYYPHRESDVAASSVFVVPADVDAQHTEQYAKDSLEEINSFNQGEVYGVVIQQWDAHGKELESDAVWGFVGDKHAETSRDTYSQDAVRNYDDNLSTPTLF